MAHALAIDAKQIIDIGLNADLGHDSEHLLLVVHLRLRGDFADQHRQVVLHYRRIHHLALRIGVPR